MVFYSFPMALSLNNAIGNHVIGHRLNRKLIIMSHKTICTKGCEARVALGSLNGVLCARCIMKQKQWNKKAKCYCCVLWRKTIKEEESFICLSMFYFFIKRRGGWISHGDRFLIIKENDYFVHLSNKAH